jgi:hypothetical protein
MNRAASGTYSLLQSSQKQERAQFINKHDAETNSLERRGSRVPTSAHEIAASKAQDSDVMIHPDEFDQNSFMADHFVAEGCHEEWESIQRAWAELNADIAAKRSDVYVRMYICIMWAFMHVCICMYVYIRAHDVCVYIQVKAMCKTSKIFLVLVQYSCVCWKHEEIGRMPLFCMHAYVCEICVHVLEAQGNRNSDCFLYACTFM